MQVPFRARTAHPPDPIVPLVWCAVPIQWLHPNLLAALPAVFFADSLWIFVSWRRAKSSCEVLSTLAVAEAQELGFEVTMDQSPIWSHHRFPNVEDFGMNVGWHFEVVR